MKLKNLGRTGLQVTEICLGTMTWGVQNTEAEAHAQIDYALDAGINFMDTAELYAVPPTPETYGKTERYIGTWFKKTSNRDKFILATKIAGGGSNAWIRNGTRPGRDTIREAVEGSLTRLQTDYIDLYQIHWPSRGTYHFDRAWDFTPEKQDTADTPAHFEEMLGALDDLVREGKIRHIGLSNESAWGIAQWLKIAEAKGLPRVASVQNEYSLIKRAFDHDLAELSHHENVGLLAYSPLAAGILTGKYLDGALPAGSRGAINPAAFWRNNEFVVEPVRAYLQLAKKSGLDVAQMSLAFALSRPFMMSIIIGATSMEQLKTDIAAADVTLSPDVLGKIEAIHRRYPRPL